MLWKIFIVISTTPRRILNQGRTIPAPVDYKVIFKMEVASTVYPWCQVLSNFQCRFRPDNVVVQITQPLGGAASCQGVKGGKTLLALTASQGDRRWPAAADLAAAVAAAAAVQSCGRP